MHYIHEAARSLLHLLFPHVCTGCARTLNDSHTQLCLQCLDALPLTHFEKIAGNPVEKKFFGRLPLHAAASYCYFTPGSLVQQLMHEIKYRGNKALALQLGRLMGEAIRAAGRIKPDMLVPLPLFAGKEKKRGYNQAALLCEGMAEIMHLPVAKNAVKRVTHTDSQTRKGRMERWENVEGRFMAADTLAIQNRHILLVDDVVTTGATLEACGMALLQEQNVTLSMATLCFASR